MKIVFFYVEFLFSDNHTIHRVSNRKTTLLLTEFPAYQYLKIVVIILYPAKTVPFTVPDILENPIRFR